MLALFSGWEERGAGVMDEWYSRIWASRGTRGQKERMLQADWEWVENTLTRSKWASALGGVGGGSLMRMRRGCRRR